MKNHEKGAQRGHLTHVSSKQIYKDQWNDIQQDTVIRPDGTEEQWIITNIGNGVTILGVNTDKEVYLLRGYALAVDKEMYGCASGNIEPGEKPEEAARRELKEEAGLLSEKLVYFGQSGGPTNRVNNLDHLFLALDCTEIEASDPDQESLTIHKVPLEVALNMVLKGEIETSYAALLVFYAWHHFNSQ